MLEGGGPPHTLKREMGQAQQSVSMSVISYENRSNPWELVAAGESSSEPRRPLGPSDHEEMLTNPTWFL